MQSGTDRKIEAASPRAAVETWAAAFGPCELIVCWLAEGSRRPTTHWAVDAEGVRRLHGYAARRERKPRYGISKRMARWMGQ